MQFRPESTHTMCLTCFDLRKTIFGKHSPPAAKMQAALAWREHLRRQYEDRTIYWAWKFAAREFDCTFLCIAIDACEKAKGHVATVAKGAAPQVAWVGATSRLPTVSAVGRHGAWVVH